MAMRQQTRDKLERIKEFIDDFALNHLGQPPSTREIGAEFNMAHVSAYRFLKKMSDMGMIRYEDGEIHTDVIDKFRSDLRITGKLDASVPAGCPDMVDDAYVEEYFPIPAALVNNLSGKFYMMAVKGVSMIDTGIEDGDFVLFREDSCPRENDIVVAYIEAEGNTLKRFCKDKRGAYLWAENESWSHNERNFGRKFEVRGVVIKVIKDV